MSYGFTGNVFNSSLRHVPTVGENIRRLREAAGFKTQRKFAERLGVDQSRLSDWENDRYGALGTAKLVKIAKALHVSIDRLLEGEDPEYDAIANADDPSKSPRTAIAVPPSVDKDTLGYARRISRLDDYDRSTVSHLISSLERHRKRTAPRRARRSA